MRALAKPRREESDADIYVKVATKLWSPGNRSVQDLSGVLVLTGRPRIGAENGDRALVAALLGIPVRSKMDTSHTRGGGIRKIGIQAHSGRKRNKIAGRSPMQIERRLAAATAAMACLSRQDARG